VGVNNGYARIVTPFRAVNGNGDFLARVNYSYGVPNAINKYRAGVFITRIGSTPNISDGTGVPSESCNPKFVADSSDYIRYKKLRAVNHTYNDSKFGGDQSNASYTSRIFAMGGHNVAP
jgi:hypothetical protein